MLTCAECGDALAEEHRHIRWFHTDANYHVDRAHCLQRLREQLIAARNKTMHQAGVIQRMQDKQRERKSALRSALGREMQLLKERNALRRALAFVEYLPCDPAGAVPRDAMVIRVSDLEKVLADTKALAGREGV